MSYTVTLKTGLTNVALPNGNLYQGDDVAILTDEQYGVMPQASRDAVLASAVRLADGAGV